MLRLTADAQRAFFRFGLPPPPGHVHYISRRATYLDHQYSPPGTTLMPEKGSAYLADIIEGTRKIALLAGAGSGKSVEAWQLARKLQEGERWVPVYFRFNNYVNEEIEALLPKNWEKADPENVLVIADGLDEVQGMYFDTAVRRIGSFSEKHPAVRMVVTCRTNFYELPTSKYEGTLKGFSAYSLNELSFEDIRRWAAEVYQVDGTDFIYEANRASLTNLLRKPFFLPFLAEHFKREGNFDSRLADIMSKAILNSFHYDKEHFKKRNYSQQDIFDRLGKIAFVLEMMGKNFISDDELFQIFPGTEVFDDCKYLPAFKRDDQRKQWMFEHNNIQEFLAVGILEKKSLEEIIAIISIELGEGLRVQPSWANTLSFFMETQGATEKGKALFDWIAANDPEIIIRFDPERIVAPMRFEIFRKLFNNYAGQEIWIHSNKFSIYELARFAAFKEAIEFLLEKISAEEQNRMTKMNVVLILKYMNLSGFDNYHQPFVDAIIQMLDTGLYNHHDIYSMLGALSNFAAGNKAVVDTVVNKYRDHENQYVRAGLYQVLLASPFIDDHVTVLIEGLYPDTIAKPIKDRAPVNLMDESHLLEQCLLKISQPAALELLWQNLAEKQANRAVFNHSFHDIFKAVVTHTITAYFEAPVLFDRVYAFYLHAATYYDGFILEQTVLFFRGTKKVWKAFEKLWKGKDSFVRTKAIALLVDTDLADELVRATGTRRLKREELGTLHALLFWELPATPENDALLLHMEKTASEQLRLKLERPVQQKTMPDRTKLLQERFDILFDVKRLKAELHRLIGFMKEQGWDKRELWRLNAPTLSEQFACDNTFFGLTVSDNWEEIQKELDAIFADPEKIRFHQIQEAYLYLSGHYRTVPVIKMEQLQFIEAWCLERGRSNSNMLWFFMRKTVLKLPEDILLDFTLYHDFALERNPEEEGTIDSIPLDKEKLDKQVIINLTTPTLIPNAVIWSSNASYALRRQLKQPYETIVAYLETSKSPDYKFEALLKSWFDRTTDIKRLEQFLPRAKSFSLRAKALHILLDVESSKDFLLTYLREQIKNNPNDAELKRWAAGYLMRLNVTEGLEIVAREILEKKDPNYDISYNLQFLSYVTDPAAIATLLPLLELSMQPAFQNDRFNTLQNGVVGALLKIGGISDETFTLVTTALEKFIAEHQNNIPNVQFLRYQIEQLEENFKRKKTFSLAEAIKTWSAIHGN